MSQILICDTNIWYGLGDGSIEQSRITTGIEFVATLVNLMEFSFTFTLLSNEKLVRNAIRSSFKYHKFERFEPPPIYLKQLSDKKFQYNTLEKQSQFIEFTSLIAKGYSINKKEEFKKFCQERKKELETTSLFFNSEAEKIKSKIKNKEAHRNVDARPLNRKLINLFVTSMTNDNGLSEDFDWGQIELFENTFMYYLIDIETGAKKSKSSDWNDLFQLIYVQPGEKYWTKDAYCIELIKKAGMQKYLYGN